LARRALLALSVVLTLAVPASAFAQTSSTGTSGYNQTPPPPKTTTEPKSGTAPSKEATTPSKEAPKEETSPSTSTEPTSTTPAKVSTAPSESKLPFTGLDLRWVIGGGVLLLAGGLSLRLSSRRGSIGR
jgi:hypothetical protein